jgi:hypothetical protein
VTSFTDGPKATRLADKKNYPRLNGFTMTESNV